jgi:hypothetical protein
MYGVQRAMCTFVVYTMREEVFQVRSRASLEYTVVCLSAAFHVMWSESGNVQAAPGGAGGGRCSLHGVTQQCTQQLASDLHPLAPVMSTVDLLCARASGFVLSIEFRSLQPVLGCELGRQEAAVAA